MNIAIIGCGLIGTRRAEFLPPSCRLIAACDPILERAEFIAKKHPNCNAETDWEKIIIRPDIQIIIIATIHSELSKIAIAAARNNKHILLEKPGSKNLHELEKLIAIAKNSPSLIRVGFNHRYHRAMRQAKLIVPELGKLFFIRGRYGHGGRLNYEKEWRADPKISGGGELIDQGIHLIDLARYFLGNFSEINASVHTYFWDMSVDDNVFMTLKTPTDQIAFLHASSTEWKNLFSFEITGQHGKLEISGLGGSYGTERLTFYKMSEKMGPPETFIWEYPMQDDSWQIEFNEFLADIKLNRIPETGLLDAKAALHIVDEIYSAQTREVLA